MAYITGTNSRTQLEIQEHIMARASNDEEIVAGIVTKFDPETGKGVALVVKAHLPFHMDTAVKGTTRYDVHAREVIMILRRDQGRITAWHTAK